MLFSSISVGKTKSKLNQNCCLLFAAKFVPSQCGFIIYFLLTHFILIWAPQLVSFDLSRLLYSMFLPHAWRLCKADGTCWNETENDERKVSFFNKNKNNIYENIWWREDGPQQIGASNVNEQYTRSWLNHKRKRHRWKWGKHFRNIACWKDFSVEYLYL